MNKLITIALFLLSISVIAQKKKGKEQKPEPVPVAAEKPVVKDSVKQQPQQQTNPMVEHFIRKYQLATRWGDEQMAKDALYDLIVEGAANDSIVYTMALSYFENRQYASALLISNDLLPKDPKNINLLEISAASYENLGLKDKALPRYESIFLLTSNVGVLYKMAALQYETKKYPEALTNLDIILTKPEVQTLKATFNDAQGKPKDYILKVSVLYLKGLILQETDKVAARKLFTEALAVAPDFVPAKESLAKLK